MQPKIIQQLLSDVSSGLKTDSSGRTYFKQRKVRFETIRIDASELRAAGWLSFDRELEPPGWQERPGPGQIREFAVQASKRFLEFWYRVFDVAVARALAGLDRRIFRLPLYEPDPLFDLGIPNDPAESSVPPSIHKIILNHYEYSLNTDTKYRIYYLSNYLKNINSDMIEFFRPYHDLWDLYEERKQLLRAHQTAGRSLKDAVSGSVSVKNLETAVRRIVLQKLRSDRKGTLRKTRSAMLRKWMFEAGPDTEWQKHHYDWVFREKDVFQIPPKLTALYEASRGPLKTVMLARQAFFQLSLYYRNRIRTLRIKNLRPDSQVREPGTQSLKRAIDQWEKAVRQPDAAGEMADRIILEGTDGRLSAGQVLSELKESFVKLQSVQDRILSMYSHSYEAPDTGTEPADISPHSPAGLVWPDDKPGNPFVERALLAQARDVLVQRLRPVRMTASAYSLNPESRHGIMTLNPVMKLWKEKPFSRESAPALACLEVNTRHSAECLIDLALLVHPQLAEMELKTGKILKEKLGIQNFENLTVILAPGSAYPVYETEAANFPEFRSSVIGDDRPSYEAGAGKNRSVLTGSWYSKRNHTLYCSLGSDKGSLIRSIYFASRTRTIPAFFFALGQFVHDSLEDSLIYHYTDKITYRQILEDYYRFEDRVKKNRGEKTGRRINDSSRPAVRFMFAVRYSVYLIEALTASIQVSFRHRPTDQWFATHLNIPVLSGTSRAEIRKLRSRAREIIEAGSRRFESGQSQEP